MCLMLTALSSVTMGDLCFWQLRMGIFMCLILPVAHMWVVSILQFQKHLVLLLWLNKLCIYAGISCSYQRIMYSPFQVVQHWRHLSVQKGCLLYQVMVMIFMLGSCSLTLLWFTLFELPKIFAVLPFLNFPRKIAWIWLLLGWYLEISYNKSYHYVLQT